MGIFFKLIIRTVAVLIAAYILPGVNIDSYFTALVVAVVIGVLNSFIRPVLVFFTLPLTLVTLGLFTFVINAFLVLAADYMIAGFSVSSFLYALLFSLLLSLINSFLDSLAK